ncbi:RNA polymerase sigma factor [Schlesneria sp.]|uniref:RNA polymerase sigma factor n=1 Tax=Schlesneria sp. TaxID=2762018 RepID=UPI002EFCBFEB
MLNAELNNDAIATSDGELVERFVCLRDQAAFTQLVRRHSHVVLGVCRRILQDPNDIDDVFQATFLVLVRNASRVRNRSSVASWLYGVAYRLALRVARRKHRRRETSLVEDTRDRDGTLERLADRHDQQVVDQELNALPDRYRQPLVLKYLSGKSTAEVAVEMGISVGAVDGLLKRGKDELRRRLLQRGITLSVALLAIETTQQAAQAAATDSLVESTVQAILVWQTETQQSATDAISDRVVDLAGKETLTMAATTPTILAFGITLGGIAVGLGGFNALSGPVDGHVSAGGLVTTMNVARPPFESLPLTNLASDPAPTEVSDRLEETTEATTSPTTLDVVVVKSEEKRSYLGTLLPEGPHTNPSSLKWDLKSRSQKELKIEGELRNQSEVSFTDQPLADALDYLKDLHHIDIVMDGPTFANDGISVDQPVSLNAEGLSLSSVLGLLLEPLHLDYVIRNEVLVITTRNAADEMFETRVYQLHKLDALGPEVILETITATVSPDRWKASPEYRASLNAGLGVHDPLTVIPNGPAKPIDGGGLADDSTIQGSIRLAGKNLIIRQTQRIHSEIVQLLDQLERAEHPVTE